MSKTPKIAPGSVIWATVTNPRGNNPKSRPCLVVLPEPLTAEQPYWCLAVSTDPEENTGDPGIEMPWDPKTGSTTGLYAWSRVVLDWRVPVDRDKVERKTGVVTPTFLQNVIDECRKRSEGRSR